jgi:putative proteasome-type protease
VTLCLAIKVTDGLVGIADTRVTSGTERISVRKLTVRERPGHSMFLMTSGLRAIRDKAVTYFEEAMSEQDPSFDKLYKVVNAFAAQIRRVAQEDREAIVSSGLSFDVAALVGGQLERDEEHMLYLLYPQGNWVEVAPGAPYFAIGESAYGKPILDRTLSSDTSMEDALKIAYLAFDATRTSATDVGFPLDVVLYRRDSYHMVEHRYERDDLRHVSEWWQRRVRDSIDELPSEWVRDAFSKSRPKVVPFESSGAE